MTRWERLGAFICKYRLTMLFFALGAVVRLIRLGWAPPGLNQDEASIGYDAYAILHYGIDRNGVHLPIHLIAWGSGQNAFYAYLSMPFIAVLGLTPLSIRLAGALAGIAAMPVFSLLARRIFKSDAALPAAMLLIAVNPWQVMMSRWALESNLFPTLVLFAVYFLAKAMDSPRWYPAFTVILAASLYAYGTAYFFVPLFAALTAVLLIRRNRITWRFLLLNMLLFLALALPILLFLLINWLKLPAITTPLFSIPRLTIPRVETVTSLTGGNWLSAAGVHIRSFLSLLLTGSDGLPWNSIRPFGYAYPIGLPLAVAGLPVSVYALSRNKESLPLRAIILLWLFVSVLMVLLMDVNINRINIIFYPLILMICEAILALRQYRKWLGNALLSLFLLFFSLFATVYFHDYPKQVDEAFADSLGDAIRYAAASTSGPVYLTNRINMPYIYVLFYEKIPPKEFMQSVVYTNPGGDFQQVSSFGRYRFGPFFPHGDQLAAYIFTDQDPLPKELKGFTFKPFGHYIVAVNTGDRLLSDQS